MPLMKAAPDAFSGATPLAQAKFDHILMDPWRLFLGRPRRFRRRDLRAPHPDLRPVSDPPQVHGLAHSRGHAARRGRHGEIFRLADPKAYPGPLFVLFSGGLMLGAMFMATDPVASPVTPRGMWIYGILMGVLTVLIRLKAASRKASCTPSCWAMRFRR